MKKLSIVLLALLFVTGSLFAAWDLEVSGDATASFSWDIEGETIGFDAVDNGIEVDFGITLASGSEESTGSGDLYAYLKASGSLKIDDSLTIVGGVEDEDNDPVANYALILHSISLDEFKIFAGDFTIDLKGAPTELNKAKGFTPIDDDDPLDVVKGALTKKDGGIKVLYQDLTFGLDFWADYGQDDLDLLLYAGWAGEMDGMDLAFAAGYTADTYLALSASAGLDLDGTVLKVAVDMADMIDNFQVDVAVGTVLDLGDIKPAVDIYYAFDGNDNWIGAQARVADLDLGGIVAGVTVEALDILDDWAYNGKLTTKIDDLTLTVDGGVKKGVDFKVNGKVDYVFDIFTISANGGFDSSDDSVKMGASVSSKSLIDNSEVKLAWATDDVTVGAGKITASVKVSF